MRRPALQLPLLALVLFSCTDHDPTGPGPQPRSVQSASGPIIDGMHGGNAHFFFLPPLGQKPKQKGEFNPNLSPVVEICELASNREACVAPQPPGLPLQFTMEGSGPGAIRLEDEKYVLDWNTTGLTLDPAVDYRIRVLPVAGGDALGHIDFDLIEPDRNGLRSRLKEAVRRGLVPVPIGVTVPIRFRIEQGISCEDTRDCTEFVVDAGGATVVTPTGFAGVSVPEGALDAPVVISVERVDVTAEPCLPTDMMQAEGCYRYDTDPALSEVQSSGLDEFNEDVVVGICIDPDVMLLPEHHEYALHKYDPDQPALGLVELTSAAVDYLDCAEFSALALAERGPLMQLAHAGWERIAPLARLLGPREVRALNRGFGGLTKSFSQIGWARALTFTVVAGDGQSGGAGSRLPVDPVVRVTAAHWDPEEHEEAPPVQGIEVTFTFTDAAANVTVATDTSDADGIASVPWTLGAGSGTNTLTVSGATRGVVTLQAASVVNGLVLDQIGAGGDYTCGLAEDGSAYCWGGNTFGQLGDGTNTPSVTPVRVGGDADLRFSALATGDVHACGISADDPYTYCWGGNDKGQLGAGSFANQSQPQRVSGLLNMQRISAGLRHTCAVSSIGWVYCWGDNRYDGLGAVSTELCAFAPCSSTPLLAADGMPFVAVSVGVWHTCGIGESGAAHCWGLNNFGQLGSPTTGATSLAPLLVAGDFSFTNISAGAYATCGLVSTGASYCWGSNEFGALGDGSFESTSIPSPVSTTAQFDVIEVQRHNSVWSFACALTGSGAASCWGMNSVGQLGVGAAAAQTCETGIAGVTFPCSNVPLPVSGTWSALAVGREHVCALDGNGEFYCWGSNAAGQFGDGTTTSSTVPRRVTLINP